MPVPEGQDKAGAQVSSDGRSFIDLNNKSNAEAVLCKMDKYRKVKVKTDKSDVVPEVV